MIFNFSLSLILYNFIIMNVSVGFFLCILLWIHHDSSLWGLHLSFTWESSPQLFLCILHFPFLLSVSAAHVRYLIQFNILSYF